MNTRPRIHSQPISSTAARTASGHRDCPTRDSLRASAHTKSASKMAMHKASAGHPASLTSPIHCSSHSQRPKAIASAMPAARSTARRSPAWRARAACADISVSGAHATNAHHHRSIGATDRQISSDPLAASSAGRIHRSKVRITVTCRRSRSRGRSRCEAAIGARCGPRSPRPSGTPPSGSPRAVPDGWSGGSRADRRSRSAPWARR